MAADSPLASLARRALRPLDAACNRLYGWRGNPLYQSGPLVVILLAVVTLTGIYLLFFYRIGDPYGSIVRLQGQVALGRWIRALHRYASDAALVAVAVHAFRLWAQGRSWGPRTLAWVSGVLLLGLVLVCGWTGYVMVWDAQGLALAREGARLLDALPLWSEPIGRMFVGERAIPSAFFFLNLFLHVALPVGLGLLLWIHVSRVARPVLLPPPGILRWSLGLLVALSLAVPAALGPAADLFHLGSQAPYDWFYAFWLPVTVALSPAAAWSVILGASGLLLLVPLWSRPRAGRRPAPSMVDERSCTGCYQCYQDCPYEAIAMRARTDGRDTPVAWVDADLCVSCGICAGSCAPMGVGPPGRAGRDQLGALKGWLLEDRMARGEIVVIGCARSIGDVERFAGSPAMSVPCAGNLHTSVVEYLIRAGAGGVLIAACPPRDCWSREGPTWLEQRLYHDREAELKARVDRRRVRVAYASLGERKELEGELGRFRVDVGSLERHVAEGDIRLETECEPVVVEAVE